MNRPGITSKLAFAAMLMLLSTEAGATVALNRRSEMIRVPAGSYEPLYGAGGTGRAEVATFRIDRDAVTRREYLEFVKARPEWQRGNVTAVRADANYLSDWSDSLNPGERAPLDAPVTNVSWFAAREYCEAQGKRLPTVAEWEYVAAASATMRDAARSPAFIQSVIEMYLWRGQEARPVGTAAMNFYGVRGLHDRVAEWVEDFNSVLVSDDSRGVGARDHDLYCASAAIGALDPSNYPAFLRYALRSGLSGRSTIQNLGFRCAA